METILIQKFIVVSDLHLVPPGQLSHGIDTTARLDMAVAHINAMHGDAAFVVFAGDLADHGEIPAYDRLKASVGALHVPAHMTLGNHDHRGRFLEVMGETQAAAETGYLDRALDLGETRVLVLDTAVDGKTEGALREVQIDWLKAELNAAADRPVVVVLHHNITDFHEPMDFIRLQDPAPLWEALAAHGDVQNVICGHVHKTVSGAVRGIPLTANAGLHYNLHAYRGQPISEVDRREGPGVIAVVYCTGTSTVVHHEPVFDRNPVMPIELFKWD